MEQLYWFDKYSYTVISDEHRDIQIEAHPFYKGIPTIRDRALQYERLNAQEIFKLLSEALHSTVGTISKETFQVILKGTSRNINR